MPQIAAEPCGDAADVAVAAAAAATAASATGGGSGASDSSSIRYITDVRQTDVLGGSGNKNYRHVGNEQYRKTLALFAAKENFRALTTSRKIEIIEKVIAGVADKGGRFLRPVSSLSEAVFYGVPKGISAWVELDRAAIGVKIAAALRYAISDAVSGEGPSKADATSMERFDDVARTQSAQNPGLNAECVNQPNRLLTQQFASSISVGPANIEPEEVSPPMESGQNRARQCPLTKLANSSDISPNIGCSGIYEDPLQGCPVAREQPEDDRARGMNSSDASGCGDGGRSGDPNGPIRYITKHRPNDVLTGQRFQSLVVARASDYRDGDAMDKHEIVQSIADGVFKSNGRFLREVVLTTEAEQLGVPKGTAAWVLMDQTEATKKILSALRYCSRENTNSTAITELHPNDVLTGSYNESYESKYAGNERLRKTVALFAEEYWKDDCTLRKREVINNVIASVARSNGRFLRRLKAHSPRVSSTIPEWRPAFRNKVIIKIQGEFDHCARKRSATSVADAQHELLPASIAEASSSSEKIRMEPDNSPQDVTGKNLTAEIQAGSASTGRRVQSDGDSSQRASDSAALANDDGMQAAVRDNAVAPVLATKVTDAASSSGKTLMELGNSERDVTGKDLVAERHPGIALTDQEVIDVTVMGAVTAGATVGHLPPSVCEKGDVETSDAAVEEAMEADSAPLSDQKEQSSLANVEMEADSLVISQSEKQDRYGDEDGMSEDAAAVDAVLGKANSLVLVEEATEARLENTASFEQQNLPQVSNGGTDSDAIGGRDSTAQAHSDAVAEPLPGTTGMLAQDIDSHDSKESSGRISSTEQSNRKHPRENSCSSIGHTMKHKRRALLSGQSAISSVETVSTDPLVLDAINGPSSSTKQAMLDSANQNAINAYTGTEEDREMSKEQAECLPAEELGRDAALETLKADQEQSRREIAPVQAAATSRSTGPGPSDVGASADDSAASTLALRTEQDGPATEHGTETDEDSEWEREGLAFCRAKLKSTRARNRRLLVQHVGQCNELESFLADQIAQLEEPNDLNVDRKNLTSKIDGIPRPPIDGNEDELGTEWLQWHARVSIQNVRLRKGIVRQDVKVQECRKYKQLLEEADKRAEETKRRTQESKQLEEEMKKQLEELGRA